MKDRHDRWVIGAGKYNQELFEQRQEEYLKNPDKCLFCNNDMLYIALAERNERKFCNRSCAAKFNNKNRLKSDNFYEKGLTKEVNCSICSIKFTIGKNGSSKNSKCKDCKVIRKSKIKICIICNKSFETNTKKNCCSNLCFSISRNRAGSIGGRASAAKIIKRSKDEIALYNLCKDYFISVRHNEIIKDGWDADIIIDDYKLAILWNGPWHYKQLTFKNHSLKQVQIRDKIKTDILKSNGWTVVSFRDDEYTPETAFNFIKESCRGRI